MSQRAHTSQSLRNHQSNYLTPILPISAYGRPLTTASKVKDPGSLILSDFLNGIQRRKRILEKIKQLSINENISAQSLKGLMLELRQITLKIIEDALEIEYREQADQNSLNHKSMSGIFQLPPLVSFRAINDHESIFALAEMISDVDELFFSENIRVLLPFGFPEHRNPFLLGKNIDELASMHVPEPQVGNLEQELKVLEVLRYKRASKALLKAEVQILNRMPISLNDVELLWKRLKTNESLNTLVRSVCLILDNASYSTSNRPNLKHYTETYLSIEPGDFLSRMNHFFLEGGPANDLSSSSSKRKPRIYFEVKAAIRSRLSEFDLTGFSDLPSIYLREWLFSLLEDDEEDGMRVRSRKQHRKVYFKYQDSGSEGESEGKGREENYESQEADTEEEIDTFNLPLDFHRANATAIEMSKEYLRIQKSQQQPKYQFPPPPPPPPPQQQAQSSPNNPLKRPQNSNSLKISPSRTRGVSFAPSESMGEMSAALIEGPGKSTGDSEAERMNQSIMSRVQPKAQPTPSPPRKGPQQSQNNSPEKDIDGTKPQPQGSLIDTNDIQRRIKEEVARYLKEHGVKGEGEGEGEAGGTTDNKAKLTELSPLKVKPATRQPGGGKKRTLDITEEDTAASLRYELIKLQQELFRRKVLDPRYYKATSVDTNSAISNGLLVHQSTNPTQTNKKSSEENLQHPLDPAAKEEQEGPLVRYSPFSEKRVTLQDDFSGTIDFLLDTTSENLVVRVSKSYLVDEFGMIVKDEDPNPSDPEAVSAESNSKGKRGISALINKRSASKPDESKTRAGLTRKKEFIAFMPLSKLILNKMTSHTLEALLATNSASRLEKLSPIYDFMHNKVLTLPEPQGKIIAEVNRTLYHNKVIVDGVLVDLTIKRNEECNGLLVICSSSESNIDNIQTVTLLVTDKELQVLLLNQFGLYKLAHSKWLSMEMVAQWLSSRVLMRRIPVSLNFFSESEENNAPLGWVGMEASGSSIVSNGSVSPKSKKYSPSRKTIREMRDIGGRLSFVGSMDSLPTQSSSSSLTVSTGISKLKKTINQDSIEELLEEDVNIPISGYLKNIETQKHQILLEVKINRSIEISKSVLTQWRSRNTSSISSMDLAMTCEQEMDSLKFLIEITFPHLMQRSNQVSQKIAAMRELDLRNFEEDHYSHTSDTATQLKEELRRLEIDRLAANANVPSAIVKLEYLLTATEQQIFSNADPVEGNKVSLSFNPHSDGKRHPSVVMWKILSRLLLNFKGSTTDPYAAACPVNDAENWEVKYDRRLLRDVRTISGMVMSISVEAVGTELIYNATPIDKSMYKQIIPKVMSEPEIEEFVQMEGLPLNLTDPTKRITLALKILEKLKVVEEMKEHRLELYTYPETRILTVCVDAGKDKPPELIGTVEVNNHLTLSDLRVLLQFEFDQDLLPKLYRFLYKGVVCSVRQEPYRRAWECLPRCLILPRKDPTQEAEEEQARIKAREEEEKKKASIVEKTQESQMAQLLEAKRKKLEEERKKNERRTVPVPVITLCRTEVGSNYLHLLHPPSNLGIEEGDILRIGNIFSRDYTVIARSKMVEQNYPNTIFIEPPFEMNVREQLAGNSPFPKKIGLYTGTVLTSQVPKIKPKNHFELGYKYLIPDERQLLLNAAAKKSHASLQELDAMQIGSPAPTLQSRNLEKLLARSALRKQADPSALNSTSLTSEELSEPNATTSTAVTPKEKDGLSIAESISAHTQAAIQMDAASGNIDLWLWKLVVPTEDKRFRWRQLYDDGSVIYDYQFTSSLEVVNEFKVKAPYPLLEVLCVDTRVPSMHAHRQRLLEMSSLPTDYLLRHAFNSMCQWFPQYEDGIDVLKFMRFMRECKCFPDIGKKPARGQQLEFMFQKEVRTENGYVDKFINFDGFVNLLKDVALVRFPDPNAKLIPEELNGGARGRQRRGGLNPIDEATKQAIQIRDLKVKSKIDRRSSTMGNDNSDSDSVDSTSSLSKDLPPLPIIKTMPTSAMPNRKRSTMNEGRRSIRSKNTRTVESEHAKLAFERFVSDYILNIDDWAKVIWYESKVAAMKKEGRVYCAATRLQATFRRSLWRYRYTFFRRTLIKLQSHIRRFISNVKHRQLVRFLFEDWIFRWRYHSATRIQSVIRLFLVRCWHARVMRKLKEQQVIVQLARRRRLRKIHEASKKGIIFKETKRVNGVMILLTVRRKDPRSYTRDFGIIIRIYVPKDQTTFDFVLEESELRNFMGTDLGLGALGLGDLFDKRNLKVMLAYRLLIRDSHMPRQSVRVKFSKQGLGERGVLSMTHGKRVGDHFFVCKVFRTGYDITVQCYHQLSQKTFDCSITSEGLRRWVKDDHFEKHIHDVIEQQKEPTILRPENIKKLYIWALNGLVIDTRKGRFQLMFACQYSRSRKTEMIIRLQCFGRKIVARKRVRAILDTFMIKVNVHLNDENYYYLNIKTGESSWNKPKLLWNFDLTDKPSYRWVFYQYQSEGQIHEHFVNPITGRYTHLSIDRAASLIQGLIRKFQLRNSFWISLDDQKKCLLIAQECVQKYHRDPKKLSNVVNYALCSHVLDLNEEQAKRIYLEAVELAETNPLITRLFGLFIFATCPPPELPNRERALRLITDASRRDDKTSKFSTAYLFFKYACLRSPRNIRSMMNLALAEHLIYHKHSDAERLFRRILAISPFDDRVASIWTHLKDEFPESKYLYHPQTRVQNTNKLGKKTKKHGMVVREDPSWAGWCYLAPEDDLQREALKKNSQFAGHLAQVDEAGGYWYNPPTAERSREPPDFLKQWQIRMTRSQFLDSKLGLENYYDPLTSSYFQYHRLTNSFQ